MVGWVVVKNKFEERFAFAKAFQFASAFHKYSLIFFGKRVRSAAEGAHRLFAFLGKSQKGVYETLANLHHYR